jgi:hypothetical protein
MFFQRTFAEGFETALIAIRFLFFQLTGQMPLPVPQIKMIALAVRNSSPDQLCANSPNDWDNCCGVR